jgi:hydroxymethylbilane synthase
VIRIATRASALARWQADHVAALLRARDPSVEVAVVLVETLPDRRLDLPLWTLGGKGLFVKEVQAALLDGRADVAVHSGKDLPARTPDELVLAAVPERADARDVLVGSTVDGLGPGARVATGSVRRRAQLAWERPDLTFGGLRGNIATRLLRLDEGVADAIVMAAAAVERLELDLGDRPHEVLDARRMVPQVAQGALAVECRADDADLVAVLAHLDHTPSRRVVEAERAFLAALGGDCDLPAGAHATLPDGDDGPVEVEGLLASMDGHSLVRHRVRGAGSTADQDRAVGRAVAEHLLETAGGLLLDSTSTGTS